MNGCETRIAAAEDPNLPYAYGNQPAARANRLEYDEHDRITLVRQALHQVMKNAPARCHSISRDNNGGKAMLIDRFGFFHTSGEVNPLCIERIPSILF